MRLDNRVTALHNEGMTATKESAVTMTLEQRLEKAVAHFEASGREWDAFYTKRFLKNVQSGKLRGWDFDYEADLFKTFAWTEEV